MSTYGEVEQQTEAQELNRIDERIARNVRFYATQPDSAIAARIRELDQEWSIERYLDTNAGALGLAGAVLGLTVRKKWLGLTAIVAGFLLWHALSGGRPTSLLRRRGIRTRSEIDREKFALKALRGDFKDITLPHRDGNNAASETLMRAAAT